jgi:hypothetical protein
MPGSEVVEGPVGSLLNGDIKLSCANKSIDGKAYLAMVLVKRMVHERCRKLRCQAQIFRFRAVGVNSRNPTNCKKSRMP